MPNNERWPGVLTMSCTCAWTIGPTAEDDGALSVCTSCYNYKTLHLRWREVGGGVRKRDREEEEAPAVEEEEEDDDDEYMGSRRLSKVSLLWPNCGCGLKLYRMQMRMQMRSNEYTEYRRLSKVGPVALRRNH
jgi:hypothetical protein